MGTSEFGVLQRISVLMILRKSSEYFGDEKAPFLDPTGWAGPRMVVLFNTQTRKRNLIKRLCATHGVV